jgi:hypothetical protein
MSEYNSTSSFKSRRNRNGGTLRCRGSFTSNRRNNTGDTDNITDFDDIDATRGAATQALYALVAQSTRKQTASSSTTQEDHHINTLESFVDEFFVGYIPILLFVVAHLEHQLRNLFNGIGNLLGALLLSSAFHFEEPLAKMKKQPSQQQQQQQQQHQKPSCHDDLSSHLYGLRHQEAQQDELLTPLKLVPLRPETIDSTTTDDGEGITNISTINNNKDDAWGHFTDFQDELADEASFIPSCSRSSPPPRKQSTLQPLSASGLSPLAEETEFDDEDEDEDEDGWSF